MKSEAALLVDSDFSALAKALQDDYRVGLTKERSKVQPRNAVVHGSNIVHDFAVVVRLQSQALKPCRRYPILCFKTVNNVRHRLHRFNTAHTLPRCPHILPAF